MGAVAKTRFLFKSETDAANKMLIQWLNHVSRECVNSLPHPLLDAAGGESTIDFSLPAHEQVYEAAELRSGKALSRVVTFLIHSISPFERVTAGDQSEALTNSEGDKESKNDLLGSCSSPSRTIDAQFEKKKGEICFTMDHISALKDAENDPKVLLELTVKYASDFLHLPLYNFQDILDGLKKETFIFLGNLYLSNSPITIEKYGQSSKCSSLENGGVKTTQEKLRLKVEQGSRWLLEIENAIKEYDMSSKMIAPAVNYSLAVELDPTTGLKSEQTNYYKLQKTIDDVFNSNGFVSIDHSVKALKANITEIMQMKKSVSVAQKRKHEEIRTANEIRVFVSRNILQNLTTPLGMVKEET